LHFAICNIRRNHRNRNEYIHTKHPPPIMEKLFELIGMVTYAGLGVIALWGAFCAVLAWRRIAHARFRDEEAQDEFLDELDTELLNGRVDAATELCEHDRRAMPQLALYAIENRDLEFPRLRRALTERFEKDILADIEHRLSWVATAIKSAPMIGLFGTVIGMMGAFSNLSVGTKVDTGKMAEDIMFALITTAMGLAIAVPLLLCSQGISVRIRQMEDLVASGLARLLDTMKALSQTVRSR
jgi:biopolymer transport protein ExbB/TolQ